MGSENSRKHHFVLVHGGGHGAWCWVKVVAELEKAGHRVTTMDLLGAGENPKVAPEDITSPDQYDRPLVAILESFSDGEKVILVGHSVGGLSLARVSEKYPEKISVAVYLAAYMPGFSEESLQFMESFIERENLPTLVKIPPWFLKEYFCNKCSQEDYEFARDRVRSFPSIITPRAGHPTPVTQENYGRVPRIYVTALADKIVLPKFGRKFVEVNPPNECFEIDADHSVFFSATQTISELLNYAAAKYDSCC